MIVGDQLIVPIIVVMLPHAGLLEMLPVPMVMYVIMQDCL